MQNSQFWVVYNHLLASCLPRNQENQTPKMDLHRIGHFSLDYISHHLHMLYMLILYMTYSLKPTSKDRFFWRNFSWQIYLPSEFLPEICWEEVAEEINTFLYFVLKSVLGLDPDFTFNKPTTIPTRLRRLFCYYTRLYLGVGLAYLILLHLNHIEICTHF